MDISQIQQAAIAEILQPTLDLTRQFLEVLPLEMVENEPVVAAIQCDEFESVVYFRVQNEKFFLALYLELEPILKAHSAEIEIGSRVSLLIRHPHQGRLEIPESMSPTRWHNFGVYFEPPQNEVDDVEKKIEVLLQNLEAHHDFMDKIAQRTQMQLQVAYYGYVSQMWGIHLEVKTLRQLAEWNIEMDVDLYAGGKELLPWDFGAQPD